MRVCLGENRQIDAKKSAKQASLLIVSNISCLGIAFVTNIIMTLLLSESDYGSYRYVVNTVTMLASFSNLGIYYTTAKMLTTADEEYSRQLYSATLLLCLALAVLSGVLVVAFVTMLNVFGIIDESLIVFAGPLVYTVLLQRMFTTMLKGSNRIKDISIQTLIPAAIMAVVYGVLFVSSTTISFEVSLLIYGASFFAVDVVSVVRLKIVINASVAKPIRDIRRGHRGLGFQIYKGSLLAVFAGDVLNVLVGSVSTMDAYAEFTLAVSISSLIMQIPVVMGIVLFKSNASASKLSTKGTVFTLIASSLVLLGVVIAAFVLFPVLYGTGYSMTPKYICVLGVGYLLHGFGDYFNNFLNAHGEGAAIKRGSYACGIVQVLLAAILIPLFSIWGLVLTRAFSSATYCLTLFLGYRSYLASASDCGRP